MIAGAFAKECVIALIRDFIFYPDDSKKMKPLFAVIRSFLQQIKCWQI